jgi:beta-lactamase regulating signal transducer with metallopeptidase domain
MLGEFTLMQWAWLAGSVAVRLLWQGAALGLLAAIALALLRNSAPSRRYAVGCVTLGAFALLLPANGLFAPPVPLHSPVPTDVPVPFRYPTPYQSVEADVSELITPTVAPSSPIEKTVLPVMSTKREVRPRAIISAWYETALPWIGACWAAGILLFGLHDIVGLAAVLHMRARGTEAPASILAMAERVRQRIGVSVSVPIRVVEGISTAMVTGLFRVVILIPAAMVSGMSPESVEAILAHEFAHLRRWDRWINLLQCLLETVLFFHPALWWLSRRIRVERELCCDELALGLCPDRAHYVRALLSLSEQSDSTTSAVLSSHGGSFAHRVRHILGLPRPRGDARREAGSVSALVVIAVTLFILTWSRIGSATNRGAELRFSDLRAIGVVQARWEDDPRPLGDPWLTEYTTGWTVLDEARGRVTVPRGAQVKLSIAKTDLSGLAALPPNSIFFLDARYRDLTDNDMAPIGHLTGLRALDLGENLYNLHGPGLASFGNLKNLEWLNIHGSPLDALPANVIRQFHRLRYLAGIFRENSSMALREAADLPALEFLSMKGGGTIAAQDIAYLADNASLRGLALYNFGLTDDMLSELDQLKSLRVLNLSENPITDASLDTIAQLTDLQFLDLHSTKVSDAGMERLSRLSMLKSIDLSNTQVSAASLKYLGALPSLNSANLLDTNVSEELASAFARTISSRSISDVAVQRSSNPNAPRVGILISHYTRSGPVRPGYEYGHYTYGNQECVPLARALDEANLDVYAVIEPNTASLGDLPLVLGSTGLALKTIDGTNIEALLALDSLLVCSAHNVPDQVLASLEYAVESGVGLVAIGALGDNRPGDFDPIVSNLTGVFDNVQTDLGCQDIALSVAQAHPLIGEMRAGTAYYVRMQYVASSESGVKNGTPLLNGPPGIMHNLPALYVRELGNGRIVRAQWQHPMQPGLPFSGYTLYIRAINWVAHEDVDTVW